MTTTDHIGIVGAGRMGLAMLRHMVKKGYQVTVCDIAERQIAAAEAAGAGARDGPRGEGVSGACHRKPACIPPEF